MRYSISKIQLFNYIILISITLCFCNEVLNGIIQKNYLDKIAFLLLLVTGLFNLITLKKIKLRHPSFLIGFLFLSVLYIVFSFNTLLSFVYEYFKIFSFVIFLPILKNYKTLDIVELGKKLLWLINTILIFNLVIIGFQFLFGQEIIRFLGYSDLRVYGNEYHGRLTGFIHLGTLGPISLLMLLINRLINNDKKKHRKYLIIGVLSVFFSTSKISYALLLIFIVIEYKNVFFKHFYKIILGFGALLILLYSYVEKAILSKIKQYTILLDNLGNSEYINLAYVEKRAIFIDRAIVIFKEHPFGLGFGSYGDSSSKFNPNHYKLPKTLWPEGSVFMSDSVVAHYIAEQGLFYILYLILLFSIYSYTKLEWKKYVVMFIVFYVLNSLVTMGISSGNWPVLFSLVYALFYYSKNYEQTRV